MRKRVCIRALVRTEALVIYAVLWVSLMTVYFQIKIIPKYYVALEREMWLRNLKPNEDNQNVGIYNNTAGNESDPINTVPSGSDVMKWFIHGPTMTPLRQKSRIHPHLKSYDVQKEVCHRGAVHLLIYIQSSPQNGYQRDAIRNTWGGVHNFKEIYVERIFLVAETDDKQVNESVEKERQKNDDIILCHFIDNYRNLSLKAITLLDFVNNRCSNAKYILKTDDDIFVNIYLLIEKFIPQIVKKPKSVVCHGKYGHPIVTDPNSKWYMPSDILPKADKGILPTFCTGYAVLFTIDLVPMLLNASFTSPFVQVDDVYMFGFLLKRIADVNFIDAIDSFTLNQELGLAEYQDAKKPLEHCVLSAWEKGTQEKLWERTIDKLSAVGKNIVNPGQLPYEY
ncbi:beta-1,3-galactosyltransferase 1-like [Mizuhopecten yessoensis]|uniref:Hexosyltransferase n=1 Tax=Mizuhopecten yessoensis TaxID=6573 RepID=A0A210Q4X8_MIZYE|nr:beta-1,3-galactosyltransferase 1-like [Mizuhopecten yessoensis]OWF43794.1 Beta-1,3-galactosyltransferase 1 [Mizuhopecten yessoensis]